MDERPDLRTALACIGACNGALDYAEGFGGAWRSALHGVVGPCGPLGPEGYEWPLWLAAKLSDRGLFDPRRVAAATLSVARLALGNSGYRDEEAWSALAEAETNLRAGTRDESARVAALALVARHESPLTSWRATYALWLAINACNVSLLVAAGGVEWALLYRAASGTLDYACRVADRSRSPPTVLGRDVAAAFRAELEAELLGALEAHARRAGDAH